jgi:hypothetical protein
MTQVPVREENAEGGAGMFVASLLLATASTVSIWVFHNADVWAGLVLIWIISVILCFAINPRWGRWSLLGIPIAFSFIILISIACATGHGCL